MTLKRLSGLLADPERRLRLSRLAFIVGVLLIAVSVAARAIGIGSSPEFGWKKATLLLIGADTIVLGLLLTASRIPPPDGGDSSQEPGLRSLLVIGLSGGVLAAALAISVVIVALGQTQASERLAYVSAALVVVPLSATLALREAYWGDRTRAAASESLAIVALLASAAVLCVARLLWAGGTSTLSSVLVVAVAVAVVAAAIALLARCGSRTPTVARWLPATVPLMLGVAAIPFIPSPRLTLTNVAIAVAVAGAACAPLVVHWRPRAAALRALTRAADVLVPLALALVLAFLARPTLELAANQNYYLAPVTDVLHGHPMLVSTFSQYGVAIFDLLAGFFLIVPIGYGTFTLLLAALTVLLYIGIYVVLRWTTASISLAIAGIAVVASLNLFAPPDFYTFFPSTGVLRFGLPWLLIVLALAAARAPVGRRRLFDVLGLVVLGIAAVWSAETGMYSLGTATALAVYRVALTDVAWRERTRVALRRVALVFGAYLGAILAFSLITLAASGTWPHWGTYLDYIKLYTVQGFSALPVLPWSPGLVVGTFYVLSGVALILIVIKRPIGLEERKLSLLAAAGLTVFGALAYTYFLGRAHPDNLEHISPPAVALLFVWLGIIRSALLANRQTRAIAITSTIVAACIGGLIVGSQLSSISDKYGEMPLAAILGASSPQADTVGELADNPVIDPQAPEVASFVKRLKTRPGELTIILWPPLETETLLRLDAGNAVGSSNACQESFAPTGAARVKATILAMRPGGTLIAPTMPSVAPFGPLLPIQTYAADLLAARFKLALIAASPLGIDAFKLTPSTHPGDLNSIPAPPASPISYVGCA